MKKHYSFLTIVILVIAWSHLVSCNSGGSNIQALSRLSTSANRLIAEYKFDSAKLSIDSLKIIGADAAYVKAMEDATNESGFMGLPAGGRDPNGLMFEVGQTARWASSTEGTSSAYMWARSDSII